MTDKDVYIFWKFEQLLNEDLILEQDARWPAEYFPSKLF